MICALCGFPSDILVPCKCGDVYCSTCRELHECDAVVEPPLWPHQKRGLAETIALIQAGENGICVTAPTGAGKTVLMKELIRWALKRGWRIVVYTHRKILVSQTSGVFEKFGINHGVMASQYRTAFLRDVQVASLWTINKRVYDNKTWKLPEANLVIVDELHNNAHDTATKIINDHKSAGAVLVGFTATPVGVKHLCDRLVVAGTNSELRRCGAHIPCETYGPDEPDLRRMKRNDKGEFVLEDVVKRIMVREDGTKLPRIFGSVLENWRRLNPDQKPTVLFAPGVPESRWFVEFFRANGITAAHIDGETPFEERQEIFEGSKNGDIKIICNRFVLREGWDAPWLAHGILATAFGAPSNWLQAVGRLLRSYPGLDRVVLQDHGGHWHRPGFGSPNSDRVWSLDDTDKEIVKREQAKRDDGECEPEPICCPKCQGIRRTGSVCPFCGYEHKKSVRAVVQVDGTLKLMRGPVNKPKRKKSDEEKLWSQYLFQGLYSGQTFNQVAGRFRKTLGYYPPQGLPHMPKENSIHWDLKVRDVCPYLMKRRRAKA